MGESPEPEADLPEAPPGPGRGRLFFMPLSCRKALIFPAIFNIVMPGIRGFSLVSRHGNATKKESGFLWGSTASIALHNSLLWPVRCCQITGSY
jgi:hypothetical protein